MKQGTSTPDAAALLAFIAEELERCLAQNSPLFAALTGLQRCGATLVVRVESTPGGGPARVVLQRSSGSVPEWSTEDRELLHSIGIACETNDDPRLTPEPRRRQSR